MPVDPLGIDEKRQLLAQIVRLNPLDCLDDSGAFDLDRARQTLPACAVQELIIDETTRTDRDGNTTTRRRIRVRLVDKLRALKLDDLLERQIAKDREKESAKKDAANQIPKPSPESDDLLPDSGPPRPPILPAPGGVEDESIPWELRKNPPNETLEEKLARAPWRIRALCKHFPEADPKYIRAQLRAQGFKVVEPEPFRPASPSPRPPP